MFQIGDKVIYYIDGGSFYITNQNFLENGTMIIYKGYDLSRVDNGKVIYYGANENSLKLDLKYYRKQKLMKICSKLEK